MAQDPRGEAFGRDTRAESVADDETARALASEYGRSFRQGDVLFREGEPSAHALVLQHGKVRLVKRVRSTERALSVLRPGDVFGEGALVDDAPRRSTAIALSDGSALSLDRAALRAVLRRFPAVAERLVSQLVERLHDAEDQIEVLMIRDTPSKVVSALLKMVGGHPGPIELTLSPVDLSARVGLDVDTVKRTVQRLRDQQYLRIVGERIEIPDVDALRRLYVLLGTKEDLRGER